MRQTAWTKKTPSLPSDRIAPAYKQPTGGNTAKSKGKQKEVPKSKEVKRLEELRDGLTNTQGLVKDPNGGCFCLARIHELSTYTPICRQCGLILCSLNMPYFACPHCTSRLLTDAARESLITSLETQISDTLAKQERARQQAVEDARKAAGAFPSLGTATSPAPLNPLDSSPVNQTHKVLSLNSKTRKIKVESRKTVTTSSSPASASDAENQVAEKVPPRIPHPPPDVVVPSDPLSSDRLWARLDNHDVLYVPPPKTASQKSNKAGKGKMKREAGADGGHGSSSGVNKPA